MASVGNPEVRLDNFLAGALRAVPETMAFAVDRNLRIVFAEGEAFEATDQSPEQVVGRRLVDVLPPAAFQELETEYRQALAGEPRRFDYLTAESTWLRIAARPLLEGEQIAGAIVISTDVTAEKQEQAQMAEAADSFASLFDEAPTPLATAAPDGCFTRVNASFAEFFGYRPGELIGRHYLTITDPRDAESSERDVRSVLAGERPAFHARKRYLRRDGSPVEAVAYVTAVRGPDGKPLQTIVQVHDLTDELEVEAELRQRAADLDAIVEGAAVGLALAEPGDPTKFIHVNNAYASMIGYTPEELVGKSLREISVAEDLDEVQRMRERAASDGAAGPLETRFLHKDGHIVAGLTTTSMIRDAAGKPLYLASQAIDISQRKRLEQEDGSVQEMFEAAFRGAPVAIGVSRGDGIILRANPPLCRLLGRPAEKIEGRSIREFVAPEDRTEAAIKPDEFGAEPERAPDPFETRFVRSDGSTIPVELTAAPAPGQDGQSAFLIVHAEDISFKEGREDRLRWQADHDPLTGVFNRRLFEEELVTQIARSRRYDETASLVMLDVDGFKAINDRYGHRTGDKVLQALAQAVRARLRAADRLGRVGGDEFAVLLPHASAEQAALVVDGLRAALQQTLVETPTGEKVAPNASFGIAEIGPDALGAEEVFDIADKAMYEDKRRRL